MIEQSRLFLETMEDALEALAARVGGKKELAVAMRTDLQDDPEEALRWFNACANRGRREKFHAIHLRRALKVGRQHRCHILKHWLDEDVGYEPGRPKAGEHMRDSLLKEVEQLTFRLREVSDQLARVDEQSDPDADRRIRSAS